VDNNIWVANSYSNTVTRLDNNGVVQATIPVGNHPTGVAVDSNGKVWVTNLNSDNIMRINPATNAVDLTVSLGAGSGPYNYSDMTGTVAFGSTAPQGTWTVTYDSGMSGAQWGTVTWNTEIPIDIGHGQVHEPDASDIKVFARAAETPAGLAGETFVEVQNGVAFSGLTGQWIEVQGKLFAGTSNESPILTDLRISKRSTTIGIPYAPQMLLAALAALAAVPLALRLRRRAVAEA
jgi:YVTN family beta-propeller protein